MILKTTLMESCIAKNWKRTTGDSLLAKSASTHLGTAVATTGQIADFVSFQWQSETNPLPKNGAMAAHSLRAAGNLAAIWQFVQNLP